MKTFFRFSFLAAFLLYSAVTSTAQTTKNKGWISLLDSNLSQWDMYLSYKHQDGYTGKIPVDASGKPIEPIGYNKKEGSVFTIINENNTPVLKVSGEYYGCVFTKNSYRNYRLKLKVKWGTKKWEPRTTKLLDAGVLYHSQGPAGVDYWRAWMLSQEFQLMEGHFGDYWNIANAAIDIKAYDSEGVMSAIANEKQPFLSFGTHTERTGYCTRKENYENPMGEWTAIELVCFEGKSLHIVNGHVVMVLQNSRFWDGNQFNPLLEGKIQLQSEAGEVYYKEVMLQPITALPTEFVNYF
ncbi:3-keto-disaccharide hydrolase [Flavobacterium restrictum]|uniref:DUF1080 domain-containing protein n=1 Tax=Flavobacterium restrictum TaxID=2594428 RepID=A0A553E330_9FLAO|nr:DUF1080 domain-containing protein [Flavobacterium restrictum]TRX39447.1 DUF1080 domain-containing protein [Flavobacterium restrictum]